MTNFAIKVRPDLVGTGTNKIEVFLDTNPKREIMVLTVRGDSLDMLKHEDEFRTEDEALYYAVERIAQLESIVESQKASVLRLAYEDAKERIAQLEADVASNLTMQVAQDKWRQAGLERDELLALFEFLEQEARRSRTGISFDWVPTCEGEPSGYRFMRHHHVGQPTKTLRKAIEQWQKRQGEENA